MSIARMEYKDISIELDLYPGTQEPIYRLYRNGERIECMTPAQERVYPKIPAWIGTALVNGYKAAKSSAEKKEG